MVSGWALVGNIVFAPRRQINSQRDHGDGLISQQGRKGHKDRRNLTDANEANERVKRTPAGAVLRYIGCLL
jgi:hypothetical protein